MLLPRSAQAHAYISSPGSSRSSFSAFIQPGGTMWSCSLSNDQPILAAEGSDAGAQRRRSSTKRAREPADDRRRRVDRRHVGFTARGGSLASPGMSIPSRSPIEASTSLISFNDLRPKFGVRSISASVF
jgi:hypothetical protein